jgi:exonuclease VII small subunit
MSKETIKYHADLIKQSIAILEEVLYELEQGKELSEQAQGNMILAVSQLEDVRDIAFAEDEAKKTEIMNKWL